MRADVGGESEARIDEWRAFVLAQHGASGPVVEGAEARLREDLAVLSAAGLDADEAFLVALKRLAADDASTRAFAREYSDRLLDVPSEADGESRVRGGARVDFLVMLAFAVGAAVAIKVPALLGYQIEDASSFYLRNLSLFVLPFLAGYLGWKRGLRRSYVVALAAIFVAGAVFANVYPFTPGGATEVLTALHLPIALWLAVGVAYAGGDWRSDTKRMDYVRFTGEWFVNYTLIALGGGVLTAITVGIFEAIGLDVAPVMQNWVLPCGAMGAVLVAAWLVEARRSLAGGMAPMLARVFTPLFAVMLVALLVGVVWARGFLDVEREVLILFDALLVVVVALLLYGLSARDPRTDPDIFDRIQLLLVVCALAVDVFALVSIVGRTSAYGFSANKTAALGLNVILLVNLAVSALLQTGFVARRRSFMAVERWQMLYMPVYALWAAVVVIVFPPLFGFV